MIKHIISFQYCKLFVKYTIIINIKSYISKEKAIDIKNNFDTKNNKNIKE
jgi:hypothetical protein